MGSKKNKQYFVYLEEANVKFLKKMLGVKATTEAIRIAVKMAVLFLRREALVDEDVYEKIKKLGKRLGKEPQDVIKEAIDFYNRQFK